MRLRNKKTGEVKKMWKENICLAFGDCNKVYYSLAELNDEWEDYEPKEPLIKDEKIRKAVRFWAEANNIDSKHYHNTSVRYIADMHKLVWIKVAIEFNDYEALADLDDKEYYTIAELCGEEAR